MQPGMLARKERRAGLGYYRLRAAVCLKLSVAHEVVRAKLPWRNVDRVLPRIESASRPWALLNPSIVSLVFNGIEQPSCVCETYKDRPAGDRGWRVSAAGRQCEHIWALSAPSHAHEGSTHRSRMAMAHHTLRRSSSSCCVPARRQSPKDL